DIKKESIKEDQKTFVDALEDTFHFAMIIAYAQGMHMLSRASDEYGYELKLHEIAKIWRGGCIIRSEFLNDIYNAYNNNQQLGHLLLDEQVKNLVSSLLPSVRKVISSAVNSGIAVPAYTSALSYFDAFRTARLPSNLIQAQRDYFGSHTYELIGKEGVFHTQWTGKNV
ncbi:MAG: NADP-dependent phosphogluconate dehydrogenase, partial [Mucilaginibacter polytrichastri]|nr:NADP-dependent phosphogluconate dehydrogenase [Mucilaginibacter polytrichastri]